MAWTIYCHTHVESGRCYVGLTRLTMMRRWHSHVYAANRVKNGGPTITGHFPNAIRKYGKDAFEHRILQICETLEDANAAEREWIEKLDSRDPEKGFNLMLGGQHVPHPIKNPWDRPDYREKNFWRNTQALLSSESRAKQRISASTPESRKKRSNAAKDLWSNLDFRERVTVSNKIVYSDPVVRDRAVTAMKESFSSPKSKAKRASSTKKMWRDPDYRLKNAELWENEDFRKKCESGLSRGASLNRLKTHCRNGHEFTPENTHVNPRGSRECRECSRKSSKASARRRYVPRSRLETLVTHEKEAS